MGIISKITSLFRKDEANVGEHEVTVGAKKENGSFVSIFYKKYFNSEIRFVEIFGTEYYYCISDIYYSSLNHTADVIVYDINRVNKNWQVERQVYVTHPYGIGFTFLAFKNLSDLLRSINKRLLKVIETYKGYSIVQVGVTGRYFAIKCNIYEKFTGRFSDDNVKFPMESNSVHVLKVMIDSKTHIDPSHYMYDMNSYWSPVMNGINVHAK